MIEAGTYPPISIDLGKDEPGMTLQYRDVKNGYIVWRDYQVDGEVVKSPVDSGISNSCFAPSTGWSLFAFGYNGFRPIAAPHLLARVLMSLLSR